MPIIDDKAVGHQTNHPKNKFLVALHIEYLLKKEDKRTTYDSTFWPLVAEDKSTAI